MLKEVVVLGTGKVAAAVVEEILFSGMKVRITLFGHGTQEQRCGRMSSESVFVYQDKNVVDIDREFRIVVDSEGWVTPFDVLVLATDDPKAELAESMGMTRAHSFVASEISKVGPNFFAVGPSAVEIEAPRLQPASPLLVALAN